MAYAAMLGLLLAGTPALAESLSASGLPACCNSVYCPLHHHQAGQSQNAGANCNAQGTSKSNDCSMRACDATPSPALEIAPFALVAPPAINYQAGMERVPVPASRFISYTVSIPSTPPPRTLPS